MEVNLFPPLRFSVPQQDGLAVLAHEKRAPPLPPTPTHNYVPIIRGAGSGFSITQNDDFPPIFTPRKRGTAISQYRSNYTKYTSDTTLYCPWAYGLPARQPSRLRRNKPQNLRSLTSAVYGLGGKAGRTL